MKYYGDSSKMTLELVAMVNNNKATKFIKSKGMLTEYILEVGECEHYIYDLVNVSNFKKKAFRGENYFIEYRKLYGSNKETILMYKEADRIYNDGKLVWRENKKYGVKETTYVTGNFEFFIIAKTDGDATIEARYAKCDNKHRNKVTISRIEVYNASNGEIMNAIEKWKREMREELARVA